MKNFEKIARIEEILEIEEEILGKFKQIKRNQDNNLRLAYKNLQKSYEQLNKVYNKLIKNGET